MMLVLKNCELLTENQFLLCWSNFSTMDLEFSAVVNSLKMFCHQPMIQYLKSEHSEVTKEPLSIRILLKMFF